jgi:hypothetical protein
MIRVQLSARPSDQGKLAQVQKRRKGDRRLIFIRICYSNDWRQIMDVTQNFKINEVFGDWEGLCAGDLH